MRLRALRAAALAVVLLSGQADADPTPAVRPDRTWTPLRVLFVGNSYLYYNGGLHQQAQRIAARTDRAELRRIHYREATISNGRLDEHDLPRLVDRLGGQHGFDLVVLQEHSSSSRGPAQRDRFRAAIDAAAPPIRAAGARLALYMTPGYANPHFLADPGQIRGLEALYVDVGNAVGAQVIPVGLAFEEAYRRRPDIGLHDPVDGSHPTARGTYLAAATVVRTLYGVLPNRPPPPDGPVDAETAAFLESVAEATVSAFFARSRAPD